MATWRDLYHEEIERQAGFLHRARELGQTWLEIGGQFVDPTRLSSRRLREVARRAAEVQLNAAINIENEQRRRAGKPDDVIADSINTRDACIA